jgi:hypothetical protein
VRNDSEMVGDVRVSEGPEVDERYTDQARIHVKVLGSDRLTPPTEE